MYIIRIVLDWYDVIADSKRVEEHPKSEKKNGLR